MPGEGPSTPSITASLTVAFRYVSFGKAGEKFQAMLETPLDAATIGLVMLSLAPTAVMAAALMIAISLFAKSFKEAQSYLTPLILVILFPLVIGMLPGLHLTPVLALAPLFNICQLIREIFQGDYSIVSLAVTLAANTVYAMVAFYAAVRIFKSERVLFRT